MDTNAELDSVNGSAKRRILSAAIDLFSRKGFHAASVREIAEEAGVTKPTLYYYFGSKEGLGLAIMGQAEETIETSVARMTGGLTDVRARLVGFVEAHFVACRENESLARFLYSLTFAPSEAKPRFDTGRIHHGVRDSLTAILAAVAEQGVVRAEQMEEANLVLTGIINIYLLAFLNHGLVLDHERAELAVRYFLDGLRADGPGASGVNRGDGRS